MRIIPIRAFAGGLGTCKGLEVAACVGAYRASELR
jgi:hypothetical protein